MIAVCFCSYFAAFIFKALEVHNHVVTKFEETDRIKQSIRQIVGLLNRTGLSRNQEELPNERRSKACTDTTNPSAVSHILVVNVFPLKMMIKLLESDGRRGCCFSLMILTVDESLAVVLFCRLNKCSSKKFLHNNSNSST